MDNFDLTKFLAEGKLHEAMSAQDTEDIAGMVADEFTKESADKGEYLRYSVGRVVGTGFELDTEATDMSSEDLDMRGVGEGWGGNFSVKATEDGLEVRNAEKGGLVAMIDTMGNFKMLSADESRAEMGLEEGEEEVKEIKSNKMKKSELKEMIKAAMSENARTDAEEEGYLDGMRDEKEDMKEAEDVEVEDDENIDVDIEKDIEVDDEESEVDVDVKASMPGESEDVEKVQALLMKAQEAAQAFSDEKLTDQIGNTITYFTRSHVSRVDEMDDMDVNVNTTEMEAELGLEEANLIKMNNLDWGKSTAERNANLDKYDSLKTDKEKNNFLRKLKGESVNEAKSFEFTINYYTGDDDKAYVEEVLRARGVDATVEYGTLEDDIIIKTKNAAELRKAKKVIQADGFEINESKVNEAKENLNESMFPMWNKIK